MARNIIIILLFIICPVGAEINNPLKLKGPEQYGVFFINQKPPEYLEDYYQLYAERLCYNEEDIRLNVYFLEKGLRSSFRHPSKALCLLRNEQEGKKYKNLIIMHMYLKIMQNYLTLAHQYDKKEIYYFNLDFRDDIKKSFATAKYYYNLARDYWKKVLAYAEKAGRTNAMTAWDHLENELYLILNRDQEVDWDYDYTISLHLNVLEANLKQLDRK
ncbi:MAG: hypothetical protein PHF84_10405 [bacterium]|nr:hypothetical protein [bacterium]